MFHNEEIKIIKKISFLKHTFVVFSIILMSFGGKSNPDFATFFVVYIKNTKIRFFIGNR